MPGIEALIVKVQLRWVGHVIRMDNTRLSKMVFSELASDTRNTGQPLKRYNDYMKASHLSSFTIIASRSRPQTSSNAGNGAYQITRLFYFAFFHQDFCHEHHMN